MKTSKILFTLIVFLWISGCRSGSQKSGTEELAFNFYRWAETPPMGWNSWDCYGPTVMEYEVKANADYMAENLKKYGWEYVVIDIRWYVENTTSGGYNQTDPRYVMDEYGRYLPAVNRFPSAADGMGFKPIGDYIHDLGLKFGIHIMRGVPIRAVNNETPVMGSDVTAKDIYSPENQCNWLRDNYTIDTQKKGAQEYYNSIFELYASWGVDFVKVDDLTGHLDEIEMVRKAIDNSGRPMVFSISPGPNQLEHADFLVNHANMWRTVGDFWDNWPQLKPQFEVCAGWAPYTGTGHYPDADMLPMGKIGIRAERGEPRMTGFTVDEQYTVMTLFSIFRSPLMFGGDLPSNDEFTLSLLTNKEVLYVNQHSSNGRQLFRNDDLIAWVADDPGNGDKLLALFNAKDQKMVDEDKALWKSDLITSDTPGQSVDIDLDISGARKLYLVTTYDTGERSSMFMLHNSNWINPELVVNGKSFSLTDSEWVRAVSGRGEPTVNQTRRGESLTIDGKTYSKGINVNANSIIEYNLPEGTTRFRALAGLDGSLAGRPNSVRIMLYTQDPAGPVPGETAEINVSFDLMGLEGTHSVTDLWTGEKLGKFTGEFSSEIRRHGAGLYRIH